MRSSRQFSFLNGPNKIVFVRIEGNTITGLVGPPYPYCLLVAFCAFAWLSLCAFWCFLVLFCPLVCAKSFRKKIKSLKLR